MGIEVELDFGNYERNLRQKLWRIYKNQLNEHGRRSVNQQYGSYDGWADYEWKKKRPLNFDYSEWIARKNHISEGVAQMYRTFAGSAAAEMRECEWLLGAYFRNTQAMPGIRDAGQALWAQLTEEINSGRGSAWGLGEGYRYKFMALIRHGEEIESVRVAEEQARLKSLRDGYEGLKSQK